jgi:hypothetical protein
MSKASPWILEALTSNCSTSIGYYAVMGNEIILPTIFGMEADVAVITEESDQSPCSKYCSTNKVTNVPMDKK